MTEKKSKPVLVQVVEDDVALNDAYKIILESRGHRVITARDGKQALEQLQVEPEDPRIILLDLHMPVLDGIGFLKQYDATKHPKTTIVVFTNYDDGRDVDEAYSLGAERYILKARAAPKELLHLVDSILEK